VLPDQWQGKQSMHCRHNAFVTQVNQGTRFTHLERMAAGWHVQLPFSLFPR
jgi:hypothetical protein